ncbi:MAG: hypothetical protein ABW019_12650 [Chitinophagaceae bacterium]
MKRLVLLFSLWLGIGLFANAQNAAVTATLSVTLSDIMDIHIGSASGTSTAVSFPGFSTATAYQNGVQSVQNDHLYIIASKGFTIQVSSTNLTSGASPDANHTISAAGINVVGADGSQGTTNKPSGTTYNNINLSTTAANLIVATGGTPLYKYKVTYTLGGGTRATNFINKAAGTYTATVTYTIIP